MNEVLMKAFDHAVPPTDKPNSAPTDKLVCPQAGDGETLISHFRLSHADLRELTRVMLAVVQRIGCPGHLGPREVVHDAFVTALCKPISEWADCKDKKQFFARMCKITEFAALTNRKSKHRRLLGEGHSATEIEALLATVGHADVVSARETLDKAFERLDATDRALLHAVHFEGKTLSELGREQDVPLSTVNSRYHGAKERLRAVLRGLVATIVLLFTKNVRAEHARLTWRASRWYVQASQAVGAATVTLTCGVLLPASSTPMMVREDVARMVAPTQSNPTTTTATIQERFPSNIEVAPEKPPVVDMTEAQCSAPAMRNLKLTSYFQSAVLPFALLVSPAVTQVACAGAERQTYAPNEPEEEEFGVATPYEVMCANERRRGNDCLTEQEWYRKHGMCDDHPGKCQEK